MATPNDNPSSQSSMNPPNFMSPVPFGASAFMPQMPQYFPTSAFMPFPMNHPFSPMMYPSTSCQSNTVPPFVENSRHVSSQLSAKDGRSPVIANSSTAQPVASADLDQSRETLIFSSVTTDNTKPCVQPSKKILASIDLNSCPTSNKLQRKRGKTCRNPSSDEENDARKPKHLKSDISTSTKDSQDSECVDVEVLDNPESRVNVSDLIAILMQHLISEEVFSLHKTLGNLGGLPPRYLYLTGMLDSFPVSSSVAGKSKKQNPRWPAKEKTLDMMWDMIMSRFVLKMDRSPDMRLLIGSVEQVSKWCKSKKSICSAQVLIQLVGIFSKVLKSDGQQHLFLIRGMKADSPSMQVVFYSIDRDFPFLLPNQTVIGHLKGSRKMQAYDIEILSSSVLGKFQRIVQFCDKVVQDMP